VKIPFLDLARQQAAIGAKLEEACRRVLASGWYVLGPEVEAFEREFAAYCGAEHCVGVGNGLDALHLILRAWDIGPGDEVIVPSNTYIASWLAVSYAGARPVPVEPEDATFNLDPQLIEAAITPRTKAIMPVHLYGMPAEMNAVMSIARRHGLKVLDDAAQAHGARYHGKRVGALSDAAAFSFYPTKNLGAIGDGGAVVTDDAALAQRLRLLRNYGSANRYEHGLRGFNSRLDELQAALLRVQLSHLDAWNEKRQRHARRYGELLARCGLTLPTEAPKTDHAWHLYVVRSARRDELQRSLAAADIGTMIHYPVPPHLQPAYRDLGFSAKSFPLAERMHEQVLSLPLSPHLTDAEITRVAAAVRAFADHER
jgi:dTDP-4-amino-4,6-dideoxygalactose transaminase